MHYQGRAILASVIFALLVYLLIETFSSLHQRMQRVLLLHPQIVIIIIVQMLLATIAIYIHCSPRYNKSRINIYIACISVLQTLYVGWLCYN